MSIRPKSRPPITIVHDPVYAGWVFSASHPTQGERFTNGFALLSRACQAQGRALTVLAPKPAELTALAMVHTPAYVDQVVKGHTCGEWSGPRPDLASLARLFAGGTLVALVALLDGHTRTAVHLPGAKHHAQAAWSSGFCVFADFAIAALMARGAGHRVAVLDIDAHHGDGTQDLLHAYADILTYSVHQAGIFPGTGLTDDPDACAYNWPLSDGCGDEDLQAGVDDFLLRCRQFQPSIILVAAGADGLSDDPLTGLDYTAEGLAHACAAVRAQYPEHPILMGGAGGYLPQGGTPQAWAAMAAALAGP